jgi:uncharacterized membrane protein YphA (DoxX/SURF4 family)
MVPTLLIRVAIAAVWLYEGLYCKLLGGIAHQEQVVAAHPLFNARTANVMLKSLGVVEVCLGLWLLSGFQMWYAALASTVLLVGLNTNGVIFSRKYIPDPGGMVVKNFAFLLLTWVAAEHG